jgi:hypothetical protein
LFEATAGIPVDLPATNINRGILFADYNYRSIGTFELN